MTGSTGREGFPKVRPAAGSDASNALSWSAAASLAAGLGALGFLTVGRFALGLAGFAPMAHVWTVWSMAAATVGFGAQIETVEGMSRGRGALSARHVRLAVVGAGLAGLATLVWRVPLFGSGTLFWPILCTLIPLGSVMTGAARGRLAANDEPRALSMVIAGENVVRFGLAGVLFMVGAGAEGFAWVVLAGFLVALVGLAGAGGERQEVTETPTSSGFAGALAGLVAHSSLVLPPTVLALGGASPEVVAAVFLVLTYLRAPYQFLLGLGPVLTARSFGARTDRISRWFGDGRSVAVLGVLGMLAAAGFGFFAGDLMSAIMLGTTAILEPGDYAILCALVVAVATAILRTIYVLPEGGRAVVLRAWGTTAVVGVIVAAIPGTPTMLFSGLLLAVVACLAQLSLIAVSRPSSARGNDQV